jgi:hypothetical protein
VDRTVLVLVPDDGVAALAAVPGERALRDDVDTLPTDEQRDAEVIVVGHAGMSARPGAWGSWRTCASSRP